MQRDGETTSGGLQPRALPALRGVLLDSAIIPGGAATVRLNLVPALAKYCSRLTWAWPFSGDHALHGLAATVPNLRFEPLVWPAHHPARWADAALRRLPPAFPAGFVARRRKRSAARLVKRLTRELDAQFLLTTCIFGQAAPDTDCPVFGILCDVNPSLPDDVFSSMDEWVRVSDRIFAISEFTRAQAAARWPAAAAKFVALPLAPDSEWRRAANPVDRSSRFRFIYPATLNEHKNHVLLLEAADGLRAQGFDFEVCLTGLWTERLASTRRLSDPQLEKARDFFVTRRLSDCVSCHGFLDDDRFRAVAASASCAILPSRYEGFGLPLAEAAAAGLPVICSDLPPYLEQIDMYDLKDRAIVFASGDAQSLQNAMAAMMSGTGPAPVQPASLEARFAKWTWDDVARRCVDTIAPFCIQ